MQVRSLLRTDVKDRAAASKTPTLPYLPRCSLQKNLAALQKQAKGLQAAYEAATTEGKAPSAQAAAASGPAGGADLPAQVHELAGQVRGRSLVCTKMCRVHKEP